MIAENVTLMKNKEFNFDEGLSRFINFMEERQRFAHTAHEDISNGTLIRNALWAINKHQQFRDNFREWKKKDPADCSTWVQFKTFWTKAINDHQEFLQFTTGDTEFGANAATEQETDSEGLSTALEELAMAAATDKASLTTLINTNADLVAQIATKDKKIQELLARIATLEKKQPSGAKVFEPDGYCWSHGSKVKKDHTSATCKKRKPGHMMEATRNNRLGGKEYNKGWGAPLTQE